MALSLPALLIAAGCGSSATDPTMTAGEPATATTVTATSTTSTSASDTAAAAQDTVGDVRFRYFDGSEGSLEDFAGTPTVINFWASWCPPCIIEMPAFEAVHVELAPQVAFLGFNVGDEPRAARELATQTGVTYPLAEDPDSGIFQVFGGFGMPTTVLVDAEGMIVHMISSRLKAQDLRALIAEHLGV
ncbi:MAG: TlpA family protein disulfide reductase [Acidimicrobiia bacterium]|nr:TlpA family protein disulfide reductase [Acidimicrobiia bacterium]